MVAASPRPSSPGELGGVVGSGGPLPQYGRWRPVRVRTLVKYLTAVSVGMLLLMVLTFYSQTVRECIYSAQVQIVTSTPKIYTKTELKELYIKRKENVEEVCYRNGISPGIQSITPAKFRHIYVDDTHRFLWCSVPKVACTNFKKILLVLSGKVNTTDPAQLPSAEVHHALEKHLKTLDEYKPREIRQRIRDYYKFMFVRDPLERILSAYINKFTMRYNKRFHTSFGKKIIKKLRSNPSLDALNTGENVTFNEFVRYLLNPSLSEPFNEHWMHFYKLCLPCIVQYDTIGKYETMNADADFVLDELGVRHLVSFPKGRADDGKGKTTEVVSNYYRNISSELVHRLWELYSVDYSMFGYPYPDVKTVDEQ